MSELQETVLAVPELEAPASPEHITSVQNLLTGKQLKPSQVILTFSADDWEEFILEWGSYQKTVYEKVVRLGGANDFGIDVACFCSDANFDGDWDNFQCKYYKGDPLAPATAIPEIAKLIWNIYRKQITTPRRYYFFAPKDCGPSLKKLLLSPQKLKSNLIENWVKWCRETLTSTGPIELDDGLLEFVENFDFSIFQYKPTEQVVEEHRKTPYFSSRFGGGLKPRPVPKSPTAQLQENETRYIEQLFNAYSDHKKQVVNLQNLSETPQLAKHFDRQREAFFSAEGLRLFARDAAPEGSYELIKEEVEFAVADIAEGDHADAYEKVKAVTKEARDVVLSANCLYFQANSKDKQGVCHQLANEDRLIWKHDDD